MLFFHLFNFKHSHQNFCNEIKVFIINRKVVKNDQNESIATKYINVFAINEQYQFEIQIHNSTQYYNRDFVESSEMFIKKPEGKKFTLKVIRIS